jgi:tetratricopeptide (TPR) repeat protein
VLNPYLLTGVRFPLKLMTRIDGDSSVFASIGEFRSPWSGYFETMSISAYQSLFVVSIAVVALAALADAFGRRRREGEAMTAPGFDLGAAAVFAGLAYLSVLARRNIGIFAFGVPPVVALCLSGLIARASPRVRESLGRAATWCAPALLAACMLYIGATVTNAAYRSDGRTHEFGFGVLEANDGGPAVAFARAAGLPGKVYNDMSMGGYLTWDHPTGEGVFMDGRLEVYDNEFYRYYQTAFRERGAWQRQVDRYGVNTAIIFHRWGNRQGLIGAIMADPAWTLVYHDPVSVIFVRRAGNERIITRALEKAADWNRATLERLRAPESWWHYSVSRLVELETYARLLPLIGRGDLAVELWQLLLESSPAEDQEKRARLSLGYQLARRGNTEQALFHLRRASRIDPSDAQVQQLIDQLEG